MILEASHHPVIYPFFQGYSFWKINCNFHRVVIIGEIPATDQSVLLISNHLSWWDGFWAVYLNLKLFHRRFHFMMLEEQLKKRLFLNKSGGFSIKRGSRSIVEILNYAIGLLSDKSNLVLIFPQGEIQSLQTRKFRFERGVEQIINSTKGKAQVVFLINLVEYYSNPKPTLFMHLYEYNPYDKEYRSVEEAYKHFYDITISKYENKKEQE